MVGVSKSGAAEERSQKERVDSAAGKEMFALKRKNNYALWLALRLGKRQRLLQCPLLRSRK